MKRQGLFSAPDYGPGIHADFGIHRPRSEGWDHSRRAEGRPAPPIEKMSAKYGVSDTPIRDAFRYLSSLGFVDRRNSALFPPRPLITQVVSMKTNGMGGRSPAGKVIPGPCACRPQLEAPEELPMIPPNSSARGLPPARANVVPPFRHVQSFCMEVTA